jgi:hypothetical protein
MPSRARSAKAAQDRLFQAVEGSPKLIELLEMATSTPKKTIFINTLLEILPTAFDSFETSGKQPDDLFALFTSRFGSFPNRQTRFEMVFVALNNRNIYILESRNKKRQFISDIGLDWTPDTKTNFFTKVNTAYDLFWKSSFLS